MAIKLVSPDPELTRRIGLGKRQCASCGQLYGNEDKPERCSNGSCPTNTSRIRPERQGMFNGDSRYTDAASQLDSEVTAALQPIFDRYVQQGYCPIDIYYIIETAASIMRGMALLVPKKERASALQSLGRN